MTTPLARHKDNLVHLLEEAQLKGQKLVVQKHAQEIFFASIVLGDVEGVALAIENGADVNNISSNKYGSRHILVEILDRHDLWWSGPQSFKPEFTLKNIEASAKIVEYILAEQLVFKKKNESNNHPLDSIIKAIGSGRTELASSLIADTVITYLGQQIERGEQPHSIDMNRIFAGIGDPSRTNAMDAIEDTHNRVYKRIHNPEKDIDKFLARHLEKLDDWAKPFQRPDLDQLPKPSQELIDSVHAMSATMSELLSGSELGDSFKGRLPFNGRAQNHTQGYRDTLISDARFESMRFDTALKDIVTKFSPPKP